MTPGKHTYRELQSRAHSYAAKYGGGAPTEEYLIRHLLESFLHRLTQTKYADDFILKGGVLLGFYGARRPTRDVDSSAIHAEVSTAELQRVVNAIAAVETGDGVESNLETLTFVDIRNLSPYPGIRVRIAASIGPWNGIASWDVSTGDPLVPTPRIVDLGRLLGDPIRIRGYAPETTIAEKGVTILERGIASTRWRDYVDIVQLAQTELDKEALQRAVRAVAQFRGVTLEPITAHIAGYGAVGQNKWAAWRRKERLEGRCEAQLEDQMQRVADILNPIFIQAALPTAATAAHSTSSDQDVRQPKDESSSGLLSP